MLSLVSTGMGGYITLVGQRQQQIPQYHRQL